MSLVSTQEEQLAGALTCIISPSSHPTPHHHLRVKEQGQGSTGMRPTMYNLPQLLTILGRKTPSLPTQKALLLQQDHRLLAEICRSGFQCRVSPITPRAPSTTVYFYLQNIDTKISLAANIPMNTRSSVLGKKYSLKGGYIYKFYYFLFQKYI